MTGRAKPFNFMGDFYEGESMVDWGAVMKSVYFYRWFILGVTSLALILAMTFASKLPDVYTATTKIRIEMIKETAMMDYKELSVKKNLNVTTYYGTQKELLQSEVVLEGVVHDLNLAEEFKSTVGRAIGRVKGMLSVYRLKDTEIMVVSVHYTDGILAAKIANSIARNYIKTSAEATSNIPKEFLSWFPNDAEILRDKGSLERLRSMTDEAQMAILPTITQDPILNKLKQEKIGIENEIAEISLKYTQEHPAVKALRLKADLMQQEIDKQTDRLLIALKAALRGDFNIENTTVVQKAVPPVAPSGPDRVRAVMVMTMAAFIGSILVVILLHYFYRTINHADDLKEIPELAFLGYIPNIDRPRHKKKGALNDEDFFIVNEMQTNSQIMDAVHDVRNNMLFSMPRDRNKVIMCASLLPNEGKSSMAAMLAVSMAHLGEKILLIDGDMRNPTVHKAFGKENVLGLSNYLIGQEPWQDLLLSVDLSRALKLLTAGSKAPNSTALLSSAQMANLVKELRGEFDHVIFDVPPVLHIPDALILGENVDGLVFVVKAGMVDVKMLREMKEKVETLKINLVGVVLNRVNLNNVFKGYYRAYGMEKYKASQTA